jgi:hypothetical protein
MARMLVGIEHGGDELGIARRGMAPHHPQDHYCQWRGPAKRWCVIGPNGAMVREGILTKEEAERDVTTRNTPTGMAFVSHPRM